MAGGAVEHVVFAIHPLLYEAEPPADIVALNHRVYLEAEAEVKERCLAAIARLAPSALFVQLAGASTELSSSTVCCSSSILTSPSPFMSICFSSKGSAFRDA